MFSIRKNLLNFNPTKIFGPRSTARPGPPNDPWQPQRQTLAGWTISTRRGKSGGRSMIHTVFRNTRQGPGWRRPGVRGGATAGRSPHTPSSPKSPAARQAPLQPLRVRSKCPSPNSPSHSSKHIMILRCGGGGLGEWRAWALPGWAVSTSDFPAGAKKSITSGPPGYDAYPDTDPLPSSASHCVHNKQRTDVHVKR